MLSIADHLATTGTAGVDVDATQHPSSAAAAATCWYFMLQWFAENADQLVWHSASVVVTSMKLLYAGPG